MPDLNPNANRGGERTTRFNKTRETQKCGRIADFKVNMQPGRKICMILQKTWENGKIDSTKII